MGGTASPWVVILAIAVVAAPGVALASDPPAQVLQADIDGQGAFYSKVLYISDSGDDADDGNESSPLATLMEAQRRADAFLEAHDAKAHPQNTYKVRIWVEGTFYGNYFRWKHPSRNVGFELRAKLGKKAILYGYGHPCHEQACREDRDDFVPTPCQGEGCKPGYTFFVAPGSSYLFAQGYTGYGPLLIQGLEIKYYHSAIKIFSRPGHHARDVKIEKCVFYRVGEIANNPPFGDSYAAVMLKRVDEGVFTSNRFVQIINYGDPWENKNLMHAFYLTSSSRNLFYKNHFENVCGQPLKFRDASNRNLAVSNVFLRGDQSVNVVPFQDWYSNWYGSTEEHPSLLNVVRDNAYHGGYSGDIFGAHPRERALVCPPDQELGYIDAVESAGTVLRMVVDGQGYYCEPSGTLRRISVRLLEPRFSGVKVEP